MPTPEALALLEEKYLPLMLEAKSKEGDREMAHYDADIVLCGLLKELGFVQLIDVYNSIAKWYA